jgi:hypothetical protein
MENKIKIKKQRKKNISEPGITHKPCVHGLKIEITQ